MKSLTATLVLLALAGCSTDSQTWEFQPGVVTVRSIHGEAQYGNGGVWDRLRVNMDLTNGVQIRTGHDSEVTFLVGCSVGLKLTPDSELHFTAITVRHLVGWLETRTALELPHGTVLCVVKKLSPESSFQIRSGGFTVEVRKGDFLMSAEDKVEVVAGEITLLGGGKTLQLRSREYFDLKKNEIGRVPDGPNMWGDFFVDGGVTDYALVDFVETWPESPLSPYDYGLARARLRLP
jgi:hypothetical protein